MFIANALLLNAESVVFCILCISKTCKCTTICNMYYDGVYYKYILYIYYSRMRINVGMVMAQDDTLMPL